MTEIHETPGAERPKGISRRTVAQGVAWAVPAITLATALPAVAASGTISFSGLGCKLPGNSNDVYKGYVFRMQAVNTMNTPVTVTINSASLNGTDLGAVTVIDLNPCSVLGNPFTIPAHTTYPTLALLTVDAPNSQNGTLTVNYTVTGNGAESTSVSAYGLRPIQGACTAFTTAEAACINGHLV